MTRQTDSAESTMNSATSFAADPVTTNTFPQAADAVAFSTTPASRWASCRSHNQNIQAARCDANGARRDRTLAPEFANGAGLASRISLELGVKPHCAQPPIEITGFPEDCESFFAEHN